MTVNGLTSSIKAYRLVKWNFIKTFLFAAFKKHTLETDTQRWKLKNEK